MKKFLIILLCILVVIAVIIIFLPKLLSALGLHPKYKDEKEYTFNNIKALIITTSHDVLGEGTEGKATGVYGSELFIPYYQFLDAGMTVDIASIKGGEIPIEPMSLKWPTKTEAEKRYLKDERCQNQVANSLKIADVDISQYDVVFISGGWGAAYDLGYSTELGEKISEAYSNGAIIGTVCHGALGLINAVDEDGNILIKDKDIIGVTNKRTNSIWDM